MLVVGIVVARGVDTGAVVEVVVDVAVGAKVILESGITVTVVIAGVVVARVGVSALEIDVDISGECEVSGVIDTPTDAIGIAEEEKFGIFISVVGLGLLESVGDDVESLFVLNVVWPLPPPILYSELPSLLFPP